MEIAGNDTLVLRYENIARNSENFDYAMGQIADFLFGDLITHAEQSQMLEEAQKEDLNRVTGPYKQIHTNDKICEEEAWSVLPSLTNVYSKIKDSRSIHPRL